MANYVRVEFSDDKLKSSTKEILEKVWVVRIRLIVILFCIGTLHTVYMHITYIKLMEVL